MNISEPLGCLSPPCFNRRSLGSKCGLFQTENRRIKQKLLPWKADPELLGHGGCASTNHPPGSASAVWPKRAARGTRLAGALMCPARVRAAAREHRHTSAADLGDLRPGGVGEQPRSWGGVGKLAEASRDQAQAWALLIWVVFGPFLPGSRKA